MAGRRDGAGAKRKREGASSAGVVTLLAGGDPLAVALAFSESRWRAREMEIFGAWTISKFEAGETPTDIASKVASATGTGVVMDHPLLAEGQAVGVIARDRAKFQALTASDRDVLCWVGAEGGVIEAIERVRRGEKAVPSRPAGDRGVAVRQALWRPGHDGRPRWARPVGFDFRGRLWAEIGPRDADGFCGGRRPLDIVVLDGSRPDDPRLNLDCSICWLGPIGWRQAALTGAGRHMGLVPDERVVRVYDLESNVYHDVHLEARVEKLLPLAEAFLAVCLDGAQRIVTEVGPGGEMRGVDPRVAELANLSTVGNIVMGRHGALGSAMLHPGGDMFAVPRGRAVAGMANGTLVTWDESDVYVGAPGTLGSPFPRIPVAADTGLRVLQRRLYRAFAGRRRSADDAANAILGVGARAQRVVHLEAVTVSDRVILAVASDGRLHLWAHSSRQYLDAVDLPIRNSERLGIVASDRSPVAAAFADVFVSEGTWDASVVTVTWAHLGC